MCLLEQGAEFLQNRKAVHRFDGRDGTHKYIGQRKDTFTWSETGSKVNFYKHWNCYWICVGCN
jgi:hypothetical protein